MVDVFSNAAYWGQPLASIPYAGVSSARGSLRLRTSRPVMTFRLQAPALMPLQRITKINRKVVLIQHLVRQFLLLPVYDVRAGQFFEVELHLVRHDFLAVEGPC